MRSESAELIDMKYCSLFRIYVMWLDSGESEEEEEEYN